MLYELVTQHRAFYADSMGAVVQRICACAYTPPAPDACSEGVRELIVSMLQLRPVTTERFEHAAFRSAVRCAAALELRSRGWAFGSLWQQVHTHSVCGYTHTQQMRLHNTAARQIPSGSRRPTPPFSKSCSSTPLWQQEAL